MRYLPLALILLSVQAWGADRYLNCDCANNGNGTEATCAASGGAAGAWNTPASLSLSAGDTLTGSGTCYTRMSITGGTAGNLITYAAPNGVTLDSSVSVDGAYTFTANTPPAVYGEGSSWQLVSGEVYKKGSAVEWYILREDGERLTPRSLYASSEATIVAALNRGEWTVRNATTDALARTIYIRTTDGASPDDHAMRTNNRQLDGTRGMLACNGQDYWKITGKWTVQYHHVNTLNDGAFDVVDCENWTVENVDGSPAVYSVNNHIGAQIDGGANGIFNAVVSHNTSNGLAIEGATAVLTNMRVSGEYTYNGDRARYNGVDLNWNGDSDGIGIGHDGGTVTGLIVEDVVLSHNGPRTQILGSEELGDLNRGSGLYIGTSFAFSLNNFVLRRAWVEDNHRYAIFLGDEANGWDISSSFFVDTYCHPTHTVFAAIRGLAATSGTPSYKFNNNVVWGNTCPGGVIFPTSQAGSAWEIKNNLFGMNQRLSAGTWNGDIWISSATATRTETNNSFYNTLEGQSWRYISTNYSTLSAWQTASSGGANDQYANPAFLGGSSPTTIRGFIPTNPAFKASGTVVSDYYDFYGTAFQTPPSIGAFELRGPRMPIDRNPR
jgi:hypothetical protein